MKSRNQRVVGDEAVARLQRLHPLIVGVGLFHSLTDVDPIPPNRWGMVATGDRIGPRGGTDPQTAVEESVPVVQEQVRVVRIGGQLEPIETAQRGHDGKLAALADAGPFLVVEELRSGVRMRQGHRLAVARIPLLIGEGKHRIGGVPGRTAAPAIDEVVQPQQHGVPIGLIAEFNGVVNDGLGCADFVNTPGELMAVVESPDHGEVFGLCDPPQTVRADLKIDGNVDGVDVRVAAKPPVLFQIESPGKGDHHGRVALHIPNGFVGFAFESVHGRDLGLAGRQLTGDAPACIEIAAESIVAEVGAVRIAGEDLAEGILHVESGRQRVAQVVLGENRHLGSERECDRETCAQQADDDPTHGQPPFVQDAAGVGSHTGSVRKCSLACGRSIARGGMTPPCAPDQRTSLGQGHCTTRARRRSSAEGPPRSGGGPLLPIFPAEMGEAFRHHGAHRDQGVPSRGVRS